MKAIAQIIIKYVENERIESIENFMHVAYHTKEHTTFLTWQMQAHASAITHLSHPSLRVIFLDLVNSWSNISIIPKTCIEYEQKRAYPSKFRTIHDGSFP